MSRSYPLHPSYLDSGQHDGDQVVVWEQQGADHAAVADVLDDSWEGSRRT